MFVPINTDAPLYHFPWATILLIVVNTACFLLTGCAFDHDRLEPWMLEYGNGVNPVEWISSMFAHAGFMHLIGNMFFLWGFGLVVEGKLGFRRFLMLYLGIGLLQSAHVDLLTLHRTDDYVMKHVLGAKDREELKKQIAGELELTDEEIEDSFMDELATEWISRHKGRCLGASGAIFGIMAVSLVWAPKNDMHVVGTIGFRPVSFEVSILVYAMFYLGLNLLGVLLDKLEMGSAGLHLVGGVIGFGAGVLYLKRGWVDCENWDLFAVLSGKYGRFANENWALGSYAHNSKVYSEIPIPTDTGNSGSGTGSSTKAGSSVRPAESATTGRRVSGKLATINRQIDSGDYFGAADSLIELRLTDSVSKLDEERLKKLAAGLLSEEAIDEGEIFLQEYIDRFPEESGWAKVDMARLLIRVRSRPAAALTLLRTLKASQLNEQQRNQAKKLMALAKKQISEGVEDAAEEW